MNFPEWITSITADSQSDVAARVGLPLRTLQYQIRNGPKIETVIAVADAYGHNPFVALIDLGYINDRWLNQLSESTEAALMAASDEQLTDEILRRLKLGSRNFDTPVDELDARRSNTATPAIRPVMDDDDPLAGIDPQQYAAHPRTENLEEDNPTP